MSDEPTSEELQETRELLRIICPEPTKVTPLFDWRRSMRKIIHDLYELEQIAKSDSPHAAEAKKLRDEMLDEMKSMNADLKQEIAEIDPSFDPENF